MKRTPLRKKSKKQTEKDKHWKEVTNQKAKDLSFRCQWCGQLGTRVWNENPWQYLSGHHKIKRRFNIHTYENCYLCHVLPCHHFLETLGVDVREYPTLAVWELRKQED